MNGNRQALAAGLVTSFLLVLQLDFMRLVGRGRGRDSGRVSSGVDGGGATRTIPKLLAQ